MRTTSIWKTAVSALCMTACLYAPQYAQAKTPVDVQNFDKARPNQPTTPANSTSATQIAQSADSVSDWETYINARFGTVIEYPAALFEQLPPPANDDGRSFASHDGLASFIVFGSHNALAQTVRELYAVELISDTYQAILEKKLDQNSFYLNARSGTDIVALKVIFDELDVIHMFQIRYSETDRDIYEPITTRMLASFASAKETSTTANTDNAPNQAIELAFWQSISASGDSADFEAYLTQWPNGVFAVLARNKLQRMGSAQNAGSSADTLPAASTSLGSYHTPARGTPERKAIMNAARIPISTALGQPVIFVVSEMRSDGNWAYLEATPVQPDGTALDWSTTPLTDEWRDDIMSDTVMIVLRNINGDWQAFDHVIGPTDVHWYGWIDHYGLPRALFPQY